MKNNISLEQHNELQQRLEQKLILSQAILQRLELLTLPYLDLTNKINEELLSNPFLEETSLKEESRVNEDRDGTYGEDSETSYKNDSFESVDLGDYFENYLDPGYKTRKVSTDEDKNVFENIAVKPVSLYEHLMWQIDFLDAPKNILEIAKEIIGNLDDDGYLKVSLDDIASSLKVDVEDVERALQLVQSLDPPGVGARNIRESFLIQLRQMGKENTITYEIVDKYHHLLEEGDLEGIATKLDVDIDLVKESIEELKKLNPRPGLQYSDDKNIFIVPDVFIKKVGDDYVVILNEEGIPNIRLNEKYLELLKNGEFEKEDEQVLRKKLKDAVELIKGIYKRNTTLYRVATVIVNRQRDFLDKGIEYLKPLSLKDVAEEVGVHISTVSRVVTNKWVQCPQGVFEMRKFFSTGFKSSSGEDISVNELRSKIREIIEREDKTKPYSDSKIAKILQEEGINIKRRTVTKYRELLGIPTSRDRKLK